MCNEQLQYLIQEYSIKYKKEIDNHLEYFKNLKQADELIKESVEGKNIDDSKYFRTYKLPKKVMEEATNSLKTIKDRLLSCETFEELMKIIRDKKINGFGRMAIYDTSLRIGVNIGVRPQKVYIYKDSKEGATKLNLVTNASHIKIENLPKPLKDYQPHDIEAFLSLYKDRFCDSCDNV